MEIYQTGERSASQIKAFVEWFDAEINTDREINKLEKALFYVVCTDLIPGDVQKCRKFENSLDVKK